MSMGNTIEEPVEVAAAGPDGCTTRPDDPYAAGHQVFEPYPGVAFEREWWWDVPPADDRAGVGLGRIATRVNLALVARAALDELYRLVQRERRGADVDGHTDRQVQESVARSIFAWPLPLDEDDLYHILQVATADANLSWQPWRGILYQVERHVAAHGLPPRLRPLLERMRAMLSGHHLHRAYRPLVLRLDRVLAAAATAAMPACG